MSRYQLGDISNTYVASPEEKGLAQFDPNDPSSLFNTLTDTASNSLDRTLDNVARLATTKDVQDFLKDNGIDVYVANMNREAVKVLLAWVGAFTIGMQLRKIVKNKYVFSSLLLGAGVLFFRNANTLNSSFSNPES